MTVDILLRQHLIDPEVCIRCNTCEAICPVGAITHDSRNYVVDASKCNACMACVPPCPTGSIDHWRNVVAGQAYSLREQLGWDELPPESPAAPAAPTAPASTSAMPPEPLPAAAAAAGPRLNRRYNATLPPWSAARAYPQQFGPGSAHPALTATVAGNVRVTAVGREYDTHHIVLDLGALPLPVLEGQSVGIVPPGLDDTGRAHHPRQYSVASPRNGERPGYNNLSLTVKRVLQDHQGRPVRGLASNHLCDLRVGDPVQLSGPFGTSFLMPNHPGSHLVMICTGTGSAPMRAMTEWRRRQRLAGNDVGGRLLLFFGARTAQDLPYFGPLQNLPRDFIDIHFAYSRAPGQPRRHVQDVMHEQAATLGPLLADPQSHFYLCGLRAMEEGVLAALADIAGRAGLDWDAVGALLQRQGRLHLETY